MACPDQTQADQGGLLWDDGRLQQPHGQPDKAARVRQMFDAIAPTYQRVNTVSSAGRDAYWRRRTVEDAGVQPGARVLDVACGTGDLARAFLDYARPAQIIGADFSWNMLRCARPGSNGRLSYCRADALRLPFADGSFDVVSCAFGVRNFQDLDAGLREFARVLRPGGKAMILEFSLPHNALLRSFYLFYFRRIMPVTARLLSRDRVGAYRYLPQSVLSFFSDDQIIARLRAGGFDDVRVRRMTFGIVSAYRAVKGTA